MNEWFGKRKERERKHTNTKLFARILNNHKIWLLHLDTFNIFLNGFGIAF